MTVISNIISTATTKISNGISSIFGGGSGNKSSIFGGSADPAATRLAKAGMNPGGGIASSGVKDPNIQVNGPDYDWRVRISISPNSKILYWDPSTTSEVPGILRPLKDTDGFIFPYTPQVTVSHSASYSSVPLTHSNYAQYFYESSQVASINVSGEFTVQDTKEAEYFMAAIYFFRACTKMFYGLSSEFQGSPPPIVYLDGYGQHYLPHVPCVVTNFSHTMPADVDYLPVTMPYATETKVTSNKTPGGAAGVGITLPAVAGTNAGSNSITTTQVFSATNRVPTVSTFSITLQPIISRTQAINFDYKKFAQGGLISGSGNKFPGGYL